MTFIDQLVPNAEDLDASLAILWRLSSNRMKRLFFTVHFSS